MKILITGHKGFVGGYFMRKYKDHDIVGIDIKEGNDCRDFFKDDDSYFDMVIHLAAIVGGRVTIEGNPLSVATDLSIDAEMFNWAMRTRPGRIVYFSSSAAYPTKFQTGANPMRLSEQMLDLYAVSNPDLTYGCAKLTGEYLARFAQEVGIRTHIFRPFSGYGTDQDLDYPFPSYIARALRQDDPFDIWGDGYQVRDFIHMQDIVDAVDKAIEVYSDIVSRDSFSYDEAVQMNTDLGLCFFFDLNLDESLRYEIQVLMRSKEIETRYICATHYQIRHLDWQTQIKPRYQTRLDFLHELKKYIQENA